jgi:TetR/AcrR family transcriptional regulator, regulator of autoinduction and epiphytic fitness
MQVFRQRGYHGASVDAIAESAVVAPETIYATFGSKRELLHYLIDTAVGGNEALIKVIERREPQAVLQETDPRRLIAGFSEGISRIMQRAAPVFAILAEAARTEPELANLQNRLHALRMTEAQASETLWAVTSAELFSLLSEARQWPREQYSAWLHDSLLRLLLPDEPH